MAKTIEENNTLINGVTRKESEPDTFAKFLFNREKGTACGRTAKSWVQILIFYVIFYACLAAFWVACLAVFLNTLDDKVPRFYGKGTIIGVHPGLGYQPWLKENPDSTLIQFNLRDPESWKPYVDQLNDNLKRYNKIDDTRICGPDESNAQVGVGGGGGNNTDACRFTLDEFEKNKCSAANEFGFKEGRPCVVLSLNRLIGWSPVNYPANSVPEVVKDRYKNGSIAIHCAGTTFVDKEHVGRISYIPSSGIDGRYYPYSVMNNYHQPIAMVRFDSLPRNKLVLVECRAYALNIEHDITQRLGLVHFEVQVLDRPVGKKE